MALRSLFANNDLSADRDLNAYGESPKNPIRVNGVIENWPTYHD